MVWEFQIVQCRVLSPSTSFLFLLYDVIYMYANDNALSEKTEYQGNKQSSKQYE